MLSPIRNTAHRDQSPVVCHSAEVEKPILSLGIDLHLPILEKKLSLRGQWVMKDGDAVAVCSGERFFCQKGLQLRRQAKGNFRN